MNHETLLLQQIEWQNNIISLLQKENACLAQIIQTYLLSNIAATPSELEFMRILIGKNNTGIAFTDRSEGMNGSGSFLGKSGEGISKNNNFLDDSSEGTSGINGFQYNGNEGKRENISFPCNGSEGNSKEYIAALAARMRPFMKYSTQLSLINTALILCNLHNNPATPLSQLRKLTGLSADGMAKRIMALKKAGLIVRQSAPLRYMLTEKAKALLNETK